MKILFFLLPLFLSHLHASLEMLESFEAEFTQSVTDEKNKTLLYKGYVSASKPQHAKWHYNDPVLKDIYVNKNKVVIIEPEIEQVIIKRLDSDLDFFQIMQHAKQTASGKYEAVFKNTLYTIEISEEKLTSISYKDEFENDIKISFSKQKQNAKIDLTLFEPSIPLDFDVISE